MKLTVGDYEIEIKAKAKRSSRANKEDASTVINDIAIYASEAAERYHQLGLFALEKEAHRFSSDARKALEQAGYYDNL